ncbi:hypothetical protein [Lysobacter sp. Root690]|uniref:hypothetical protein n=1 Tax=Lysobacter sp. Root690 TaxID=1736588 RepID=UPI0006F78D7E|nr:hypothetical protein [Lysobacter sp. Root690]KRB07651.1 hypothetical protein ASD86_07440 [Lysobacter sp. Root690]
MEPNLYAPPTAAVTQPAGPADRGNEFFIVSARKFCILFFATFGLYHLYWSYMHWARYRAASGEYLWPVARTLLSIFYTHALTARIDGVLRKAGRGHAWAPGAMATLYVIASIGNAVLDRLSSRGVGSPYTDVLGVLALLPVGWSLLQIQRAANAACGDPRGESNARLTPANYAWIALGAVLWVLILLGIAVAFGFGEINSVEMAIPQSALTP